MSLNLSLRAEALAIAYAKNRTAIRELSKQIETYTAFSREGGQVYLDDIRNEYLEDGDRWRGWKHAIEHVQGIRDSDDPSPITPEQHALADLLDRKACLRVEAGAIKRSLAYLGRTLLSRTS